MKALIIVDLQNDFLPGGALPVPNGDKILPTINAIQRKFDLVIATKDWHPKNHVSFASVHGKEIGTTLIVEGTEQRLWPVHCVQGTQGAEFSPLLETKKIAHVFCKGMDPQVDSYSTFFDNAHHRSSGLEAYLKEHQVHEITLVGLATDYCVKYSALDAKALGFSVNVAIDGCMGIDACPGDIEKAFEEMKKAGINLLFSYQIID